MASGIVALRYALGGMGVGDRGSGQVSVRALYQSDATEVRSVSPDTMRLLLAMREDSRDDNCILNLSPNQVGLRIRDAAMQAGLWPGYSGESPRMGMTRDLDTLGVRLLGEYAARGPATPGSSVPGDFRMPVSERTSR